MNIDEIIRKCVEVPGISIERGEYSAGLFLNEKDGKGRHSVRKCRPWANL